MKILFISQYFYPETFRGNEICFDWAERGDDVTVISGIPNYPKGKFYGGFGIFKRNRELVNGVQVVRVPVVPRGKSTILLLLNYLSFALSASLYTLFLALSKRYDIVFVQQLSPVLMSFPAVIYKKIRSGVPLFTWVLDLWPESLQAAGGIDNKLILGFFEYFTKLEYRNSSKILISSKSFSKSIIAKGPYTEKLIYFPNWAEEVFSNQANSTIDLPTLPEGFLVMFAGNLGEAQDFNAIMDAALLLKTEKDIHFIIIGDGRKKVWIDSFVQENNLGKTVHVLGRWPIETMPAFFSKADVMLVSLKDELIFNLTAPAKIQAYMQSKKPIVGMINGEGANIINDARCGNVVNAGDSEALVKMIKKLSLLSNEQLVELGMNGFGYCNNHFNKKSLLDNLYKIIRQ